MTAKKSPADGAREFFAAAAKRQNINVHAVPPPMRLQELQNRQFGSKRLQQGGDLIVIYDIDEIIRKWLTDTAKVGTVQDLKRAFDASWNEHDRELRLRQREHFDRLFLECQKRELEMTKIIVLDEERLAAARSAAAKEKREREALAKDRAKLEAREKALEGRP